MSGTNADAINAAGEPGDLAKLCRCLDRSEPLDSLGHLRRALDDSKVSLGTHKIAFGVDTNIVLHLANNKYRADVLDFWGQAKPGALIIPGQLIQEFWKNVDSLHTEAQSAVQNFEKLKKNIDNFLWIDSGFQDSMNAALKEFEKDYSPILDETFQKKLTSVVESLYEVGQVVYVPRSRLFEIARSRKETKTPPGFKDEGFGDFYIWADFLYGLLLKKNDGIEFDAVVLVTGDKKVDWSLSGRSHPVLSAEVESLVKTPFALWSLNHLVEEVRSFVARVSTT